MKPHKPGSRRQKIILYYTLAVVLPGIVLGYMASRGMRNDQALREKESRRKLEINSQAFFTAIDSSFVRFINEQTTDSMLSVTGMGDPSLVAFFISDSRGTKKLVSHKMLYLPAELMAVGPGISNRPANLAEGQRLEFAEQRFTDALRFYQAMALKSTDPE